MLATIFYVFSERKTSWMVRRDLACHTLCAHQQNKYRHNPCNVRLIYISSITDQALFSAAGLKCEIFHFFVFSIVPVRHVFRQETKDMFQHLDVNKDNNIDLIEFTRFCLEVWHGFFLRPSSFCAWDVYR